MSVLAAVMLQSVLQIVMDPRVWLGGGILFFGGIIAFAELSQRLENNKRNPPAADVDEWEDP